MNRHSDRSSDELLRSSLKGYADAAPIPDDALDVPDNWVRSGGPGAMALRWGATMGVVLLAAVATSTLLGVLERDVAPGASGEAAPSESLVASASAEEAVALATASPFVADQPPPLTVNGQAGAAFAWCYGNVCADGSHELVPEDVLRTVSSPLVVNSAEPLSIQRVRVLAGDGREAEVAADGLSIGAVPEGPWDRVVVSVKFLAGGDATYVWRIEP